MVSDRPLRPGGPDQDRGRESMVSEPMTGSPARPVGARPAATLASEQRIGLSVTDAVVRYGPITAVDGVSLEVKPGEIVALLGASGSGKSSLLRAVAGLEPLAGGTVEWDGEDITAVPVHKRGFVMMFQDGQLFPHRSVAGNVGYALNHLDRAEREARVEELLDLVGLAGYGSRPVTALSGGQAQRVALLRALAAGPRCLLLDEPLAAVDASASLALRELLATHLATFAGPRLLVTHDPVDAFVLADRVAVLEDGRIVQVGTPAAIGRQPQSRYAADLVGLNFVRGDVHDSVLRLADGAQLVVATRHEGPAIATVHPRAIALFRERPAGSPRNVWLAPIAAIEPSLDRVRVRTGGPVPLVAEITPAALRDLGVGVGDALWVTLKATEIAVGPGG